MTDYSKLIKEQREIEKRFVWLGNGEVARKDGKLCYAFDGIGRTPDMKYPAQFHAVFEGCRRDMRRLLAWSIGVHCFPSVRRALAEEVKAKTPQLVDLVRDDLRALLRLNVLHLVIPGELLDQERDES